MHPAKTDDLLIAEVRNCASGGDAWLAATQLSLMAGIGSPYAEVILIGSDLSKLVETLRIARRCRGIIMQNFVGTFVV